MSVFDRQGPPLAGAVDGSDDRKESPDSDPPDDGMNVADVDMEPSAAIQITSSFDPHKDARELVRMVQCQQCSLPLRQAMTLACGNSICRGCLPTVYKRENITYPATSGRSEGFICPFAECGREHSMGDCSNDVTLSKLLDQVSIQIARYRPLASDTPLQLDERPRQGVSAENEKPAYEAHSRVLHGGRLVATYTLAELGELQYNAEVSYQAITPGGDTYQHLDYGILEHLRNVTRNELDCHVCFALMLDPLTLACGHTYCRKCVARVLDHAQSCPVCRRPLTLTPGTLQSEPSNKRLSRLLLALCPEQVAARVQQVETDDQELAQNQQIPLFVCTLAYPRIPTFLHIFEPRYRLMIRRAMETNRKFGMLAYNGRAEPQGDMGVTQFLHYGTLLEIINIHLYPDGRSVIETMGVSRFCVQSHGMLDGYTVGRVERIDDIPLAEEEALEAAQVSAAMASSPTSDSSQHSDPSVLQSQTTVELMAICTAFIRRMRSSSAPWLSGHIIQAYGPMPDDPALFPYWFASVLPINETEKYRLLPTRSVRTRLMICAEWVRRVERTRWYARLREMLAGSPEAPAPSPDSAPLPPPSPPPASPPT